MPLTLLVTIIYTPGCPQTTWLKTVLNHLKSHIHWSSQHHSQPAALDTADFQWHC